MSEPIDHIARLNTGYVTLGDDPVVGKLSAIHSDWNSRRTAYVHWPGGGTGRYGLDVLEPAPNPNAEPPHPTRSTTLTTAEELINGDRAATYGDPAENFGRIADLWNAQFGHKLSAKFTASDVALALVHLKLSRLAVTPGHADSWIDGCGYLALGSELAT